MTFVVLQPDAASGQTLKQLLDEVQEIAGAPARTTGSGVRVPGRVAFAYLQRRYGQPRRPAATPAAAPASGGRTTRKPPPAKKTTTAAAQQRASRTTRS